MITNSIYKQYYLTFAIALILLINSCLNTSYITEDKSGIVKYLDTENYLKRKPLISKINSKSYSIDQKNQMYFLDKLPEKNKIIIKLTKCLQCVEYKADEYVIKKVYRDTFPIINDTMKASLFNPIFILSLAFYLSAMYSLNIYSNTLIMSSELLFGKLHIKDIPYEIGQIIIVPFGIKKIKTIDKKNKNHIKTGKTKWKNFSWKNGKINVVVNNKTYMFTADSEGVATINIIDLLKKIDINSEQLSINIISDNEGTKDSKKIVINDYILSKLEPKLADMSYGTSLLAPFIETDLELKYSQNFSTCAIKIINHATNLNSK